MYDELIKRLRTEECLPYTTLKTMREAADAIEDLEDAIEDLEFACNRYEKDYKALCEYLPKWIPVTERLPKDSEAVNVIWINRDPASYYQHIKDKPFVATGVYYQGQWYWWSSVVEDYLAEYGKCDFEKIDEAIDITHWMPLPEPPRGEEDVDTD